MKNKYKLIQIDKSGRPSFNSWKKPYKPVIEKPKKTFVVENKQKTVLYSSDELSDFDFKTQLEEISTKINVPALEIATKIMLGEYELYFESTTEHDYYDSHYSKISLVLEKISESTFVTKDNLSYEKDLKYYNEQLEKYNKEIKLYNLEEKIYKELLSIWKKEMESLSSEFKIIEDKEKEIKKKMFEILNEKV